MFHHTLNMSLHYLVKYECQYTGSNLKLCSVINDKSQGRTAKHLSCDGLLHCKCITQAKLLIVCHVRGTSRAYT